MKRPHREVVGAAVMDSELLGEIIQGEETMAGVEAFLVLSVATFHLAVVARRVRTDELMSDSRAGQQWSQSRVGNIPLAVGESGW